MGVIKASVLRTGSRISFLDRGIFIQSIWVELYIVAFLFLFLSDITPFPPRALSVYASIPLAFLGILYFPKASPTLRFFCVTFALSWAYQQTMRGEFGFTPILVTLATFFITTYYQQMGEEGLERLKNYLALFFILSFMLLIGTMLSDTALRFREGLYMGFSIYGDSITKVLWWGQGGLAATKFYLGYQVAAGLSLFIGEAFIRDIHKSKLTLCLIALSALALVLCGERSILVAVPLAFLVLGFIVGKPWKIILLSLIFISLYFPLKSIVGGITEDGEATVIQKIMDEKKQAGAVERIKVQLWALSQIPFYPLGIEEHGINYETLVREGNFDNPIAPHNGYITRPLFYGWFLLFIAIVVFYKVAKIVSAIKRKKLYNTLPVLGGLIGALANALFHNASFLTFSPETMVLLMLLGGYFDYSLKKRAQAGPRSNGLLNRTG